MSIPELLALANKIIQSKGGNQADSIQLARGVRSTLTGSPDAGETFALYHARVVDERDALKAKVASTVDEIARYIDGIPDYGNRALAEDIRNRFKETT